jgi:hypothetical protein
MLIVMKPVIVLAFLSFLVRIACHEHCRNIVCEKTVEGMIAGALIGSAIILSNPSYWSFSRRPVWIFGHELKFGLVGGLLLGLIVAAFILLVG